MSKELIRAFVALPLAGDLREKVAPIQQRLRRHAGKVKWVEPENLHFTLKFLGNIGADGARRVLGALGRAAEGVRPFELGLGGVGAFPTTEKPRVIWVAAQEGAEALGGLAGRVETELARLGFDREKRPFRAHLTIGRVRDPRQAGDLAGGLAAEPEEALGAMAVSSFELMRSDLRPSGPIYTSLGTIRLEGEGVPDGDARIEGDGRPGG